MTKNRKSKRKQFEVTKDNTLETVLQQMRKEGYTPIRRREKPVFIETSKKEIEVSHQEIIIEGILTKDEH